MKSQKILFLLLGLFMLSSVSAAVASYAEWNDGSSSLTIMEGESATFEFEVYKYYASSMTYTVKLYDLSYNEIESIESKTTSSNLVSKTITLDSNDYKDAGDYKIVVYATDSCGSSDTYKIYLTVEEVVPENNAPVISSISDKSANEESSFSYQTVATDSDGDSLSYSISGASWLTISSSGLISGTAPNVDSDEDYTVSVTVSDGEDADSASFTITVVDVTTPDTTAPVITINGANPMTVVIGTMYFEFGASAYDNVDGDLTDEIVIDDSDVDFSTIGVYQISYLVSDSSGNEAVAYRTVNVTEEIVDDEAPVITLIGSNPQEILLGDSYNELNATADDAEDGDLTNSIVIDSSDVDTSVLGTYFVIYSVTDSYGNFVSKNRTVNVVEELDTDAPAITIIYPKDKTYSSRTRLFKVVVDEDATVVFSLDGEDNVTMTETSDLTFEYEDKVSYGTHELVFYATDAAGNVGEAEVEFKVKRSSSDDDEDSNQTVVNYFEAATKYGDNETLETVVLGDKEETQGFKWGYIFLLLLGIGILVMLILITLIYKRNDEVDYDYASDEILY